MNEVEAALRRAAADVEAEGRQWALMGGLAVSARAIPRFTQDIDIAIAVSGDPAAEGLVRSFLARGYQILATLEHDDNSRLVTARLVSVDDIHEVVVDLMFASSGIEPEIVAAATPVEVAKGLTVPIAQVGHLIAVKLLARDDQTRPQDLMDLKTLMTVATDADLELTRTAIGLITERGYSRDKDLAAGLKDILALTQMALPIDTFDAADEGL